MTKPKTAKDFKGVPVDERPWSVLGPAQRDDRLDRLPWHEREHFLKLLEDARPLVQMRAKRSSFLNMKYLIATVKEGGDPGAPKRPPRGTLPPKAESSHGMQDAPSPPAAPSLPKHENLDRLFDAVKQADEKPAIHEGTTGLMRALFDPRQIRQKLTVNGRLRLDPEAIMIMSLAPSFHAIATGLDPEPWQADILDSFSIRLGVLAARQCGKSLVTSRKASAFAICHPGSTVLVIAPTLRQSTEFLLKCTGVMGLSGIRLSAQSQFQLTLADKQPGAGSRIIALPGSAEDEGNSVRGFSSDMLILEEASFIPEIVIRTVLPSIAARPKAQLIGISSAGLLGSFFHSVMTDPNSGWETHTVTAEGSGRFTPAQLDELKRTLGARYDTEMSCRWSSIGEGLFGEDVFTAAFGSPADPIVTPADPVDEPLSEWVDIDQIFSARIA
jgi:hypothetical protein